MTITPRRLCTLAALTTALVAPTALGASSASASAGLNDAEAARFAKRAVNRTFERQYGVPGRYAASDWRARCRYAGHDSRYLPRYSCRLRFLAEPCVATARVSGATGRVYRIRLTCAD